jgi:isopentenyl diphosphate isomerase/L-lactate dehydrogenase-like FMN-dependent dehydrogenase
MAMYKLVDLIGEVCAAKPCADKNIPFCLSLASNCSLEEVSHSAQYPKEKLIFLALYMFYDDQIISDIIRRAELSGFKGFVITVDRPYEGKREENLRTPFHLDPSATLGNLAKYWGQNGEKPVEILKRLKDNIRTDLVWENILALRARTKLPIILKGIQTPQDTILARELGVDAVWISNHGGRTMDSLKPNLEILESCRLALTKHDTKFNIWNWVPFMYLQFIPKNF